MPRYKAPSSPVQSKHNGQAPQILRGVKLTPRQRHVLECVVARRNTGLTERDRSAVLVQIVEACTQAGRESALLDILGLNLLEISICLDDCMHNATRPAGKEGNDAPDYATRHAATRTALELRRRIGPGLRVKRGDVDTTRPAPVVRKGRAAAALTAAPDVPQDDEADTLPAS